MTTIYVRHDVTTLAEVNALALNEDQRENGAIVLYDGMTCYWSINWATRNEIPGRWYDNSCDGLQLVDGDKMTVLVPIEAEEETGVVFKAAGFQDTATHPYSEASMDSDGNVWFGDGLNRVDVTEEFNEWAKQHTRTRYVTPCEEA